MTTAYEQDIAKLRGILHMAEQARSTPEKMLHYRPLVDAIKRALALLSTPHPHDEPLRFAITALVCSTRKGQCGTWFVTDADMYMFAMDQIARLYGPVR